MSSLSPVCVPCGRVMLISKTGRHVLELEADGTPYKVHHGDEFECPECQVRIVAQFAQRPQAESWQTDVFPRYLADREAHKRNPYRRWVDAKHGTEPLPHDKDEDEVEEENPRQKGDDDGVEYADPRDEMEERLSRD